VVTFSFDSDRPVKFILKSKKNETLEKNMAAALWDDSTTDNLIVSEIKRTIPAQAKLREPVRDQIRDDENYRVSNRLDTINVSEVNKELCLHNVISDCVTDSYARKRQERISNKNSNQGEEFKKLFRFVLDRSRLKYPSIEPINWLEELNEVIVKTVPSSELEDALSTGLSEKSKSSLSFFQSFPKGKDAEMFWAKTGAELNHAVFNKLENYQSHIHVITQNGEDWKKIIFSGNPTSQDENSASNSSDFTQPTTENLIGLIEYLVKKDFAGDHHSLETVQHAINSGTWSQNSLIRKLRNTAPSTENIHNFGAFVRSAYTNMVLDLRRTIIERKDCPDHIKKISPLFKQIFDRIFKESMSKTGVINHIHDPDYLTSMWADFPLEIKSIIKQPKSDTDSQKFMHDAVDLVLKLAAVKKKDATKVTEDWIKTKTSTLQDESHFGKVANSIKKMVTTKKKASSKSFDRLPQSSYQTLCSLYDAMMGCNGACDEWDKSDGCVSCSDTQSANSFWGSFGFLKSEDYLLIARLLAKKSSNDEILNCFPDKSPKEISFLLKAFHKEVRDAFYYLLTHEQTLEVKRSSIDTKDSINHYGMANSSDIQDSEFSNFTNFMPRC